MVPSDSGLLVNLTSWPSILWKRPWTPKVPRFVASAGLSCRLLAVRRFPLERVNDGSCYVLSWTYTASRFWIDLRIERAHKFYVRQIFFVTCLMLGFGPAVLTTTYSNAASILSWSINTCFWRDQWLSDTILKEVERILSASPSGSQWHHVHHWRCHWKTWVTGWWDVAVVFGTFGEWEDWSWTSRVFPLLLDDFMLHAALIHFDLCFMVLQKILILYNCNGKLHRCIDSDFHSFVHGIFSIHPYSPDSNLRNINGPFLGPVCQYSTRC